MLQSSSNLSGAVANQSGAMGAETISKNGRSSKSHKSSNKLIVFGLIVLTIISLFFIPWFKFNSNIPAPNFLGFLNFMDNYSSFSENRKATLIILVMVLVILMLVNLVACICKSKKFLSVSTLLTGICICFLTLFSIGFGTKLFGFYITMLCGIALVVIAYKDLFSGKINKPKVKDMKANSYSKSALETLANRYASGEISKEEYEQIKGDIS